MKSLSQAEYGEIRDLYESIYAPKEVYEEIEISDEELISIVEESVIELIDEGYTIQEIEESFDDEFVEEILIEAKVTYGSDTESPEERRARAKAKVGEKKSAARKAAVKGAISSAKSAAKSAAKGAAAETSRRAGNAAVRAKAGATRAAMAATGVKATDVPTKSGKARKNASTFVAGRKSDRDSAKKVMSDKVKSKFASAKEKVGKALVGSARQSDSSKSVASRFNRAADKAKGAAKSAASGAKSGLKGMIGRAARKVADKAGGVAKRMGEEVETYDVVVEFLCDQGIAEDLQEAQWMMVNEVDSEDIATILEAYGLDEIYKGKHGQSEKEYQDGRSDAGKMISGDSKMSGSKYAQGRRTGSDAGPQPAGGSKKPASQGKMDSGSRTDLMYRKTAMKKG